MKIRSIILFALLIANIAKSQTWITYTTSNGLVNNNVLAIAIDKQNNKWFGTSNGISKFNDVTWTTYTTTNGLVNNTVLSIAIDAQDNKWFGTNGGVSKFDGSNWTTYTTTNGLVNNQVNSIAIDYQGYIWFGTPNGVSMFDGTNWTTYTIANGLPSNNVHCIAADIGMGFVWFGTDAGTSMFDGWNWHNYTTANGLASNNVYSIDCTSLSNNKWFGTTGGVSMVESAGTGAWSTYSIADGLANNNVLAIGIEAHENKWFGTGGGGVSLFNDTTWTTFTTINGLVSNTVISLSIDTLNNKWFGTHSGVSKFDYNCITIPTLSTNAITNITASSATSGGNITNNGGANVSSRGICWSITSNPTISDDLINVGSGGNGSFTCNISGLNYGTNYHVRAFAINGVGTAYGNDISFNTLSAVIPTLTTTSISSITPSTAASGGNITTDGGYTVTTRGVCWATSANPTISNNHTSDGIGLGIFTSNLTGLGQGTTYHVRAYATNIGGTAYGNDINFTTPTIVLPTLTTTSVSAITATNATSGGNITADGNSTVTSRGVCWATNANPTISNSHTTDGTGTGIFTSYIAGLSPNSTIHIRAYATNNIGTAYGSDVSFTTLSIPSLITATISGITSTTAESGGNNIIDGGATVISKGVCWSKSHNPIIDTCIYTTDGSGNVSFISNMTNLTANTNYYTRAYATNSNGTGYGNELTFKTAKANSTEVFLTNIAFVSSQQEPSLPNIPSAMSMSNSNPENFVNPGKKIRFKMECFNNKSSGLSIVSGLCKVRTSDPSLILTDSTSGLNNVGWNQGAWSTDEFEVNIPNSAQFGHVYYVDFVVVENGNEYFTYNVPIPIAPLALHARTIDDDNNPDSQGNGNGLCEPGEIVESFPTLDNVSTMNASANSGTFENYFNYTGISVWNNHPGISGNVVNNCYWNYSFGQPQVINAGATDMGPEFDFVFDYNFSQVYHFKLALKMSGTFQVFAGKEAFMRWLVPIDYNTGNPEGTTGVNDNVPEIENVKVYPNPVTDNLQIQTSMQIKNIEITDITGRLLFSTTFNTIDCSELAKGVYFVRVETEKGITVKKFIKE